MTVNCTVCKNVIENRQMFIASKDDSGHWMATHDHCISANDAELRAQQRFMMTPARREVLTEKVN